MGRRDVDEVVLRPMQRLHLPPRHLRHHDADDPDAKEEALREYRAALEHFPRSVLERAWERLRGSHEYSIWPTPATLRRLAEAEQLRSGAVSEVEARRQRAWESAAAYADRFLRRRPMAKMAAREGWVVALREHVEAAAWVQAQLIEGLAAEGISLPPTLVRLGGYRSSGEALAALREEFAGPVAEGRIDVRIPKRLVEQWQKQVKESPPEAPCPHLEAVMERLREQADRPQRWR